LNLGRQQPARVKRVDYAFGRLVSQSNAAIDHLFAFTARALDHSTGLQNNLNRWYDAQVGRWLSEDPIGFAAADANLYRYVENAPARHTDPSGLLIAPLGIQMRFWEQWLSLGQFGTREEAQRAGQQYLSRYRLEGWGVWVEQRRVKGKTRWETLVFKPKPEEEQAWIAFSMNVEMTSLASPISLGGSGGVAGKLWGFVKGLFSRGGSKAAAPAAAKTGSVAPSAFEIAKQGGKHAGLLRNYAGRSADEVAKAVRSLEARAAEHAAKAANPGAHVADWASRTAQQRQGLINYWLREAKNYAEQAEVLKGLLGGGL